MTWILDKTSVTEVARGIGGLGPDDRTEGPTRIICSVCNRKEEGTSLAYSFVMCVKAKGE